MREKRNKIIGCIVVLLVLISPAAQSTAAAQSTGLSLTTTPLPISLVGKPGESLSTNIKIRNSGSQQEHLKVTLQKFSPGADGRPKLESRGQDDEYFDWVRFSQQDFYLNRDEEKTIGMSVDLPETAALGYYYAVTFSRAESPEANSQTSVEGAVAVLVAVEAESDNARRKLDIEKFSVGRNIYEYLPARFVIRVKNSGNLHAAPVGTMFIKRGDKEVAKIDVNGARGNVLPASGREFTASWEDGLAVYKQQQQDGKVILDENGKSVEKLEWDFDQPVTKLRMGKYTATVVLAYSDGLADVPMQASVSFWVIPWRLIGGGLLAITLLAAIPFLSSRARRKLTQKSNRQ